MGTLTKHTTMNNYVFDVFHEGELTSRVSTTANCYDAAEEMTVELYGDEIELVRVESNIKDLTFWGAQ